jgi:hypothetical protein
MPSFSFFVDEIDLPLLLNRLNADPEIAFIVGTGAKSPQQAHRDRMEATIKNLQAIHGSTGQYSFWHLDDDGYRQSWKAVPTVPQLADGNHSLWHVPAGPLPLLDEFGETPIADPWAGWSEERSSADPTKPFFGSSSAEIRLTLWTRFHPYTQQEKSEAFAIDSRWAGDEKLLSASDLQWIGRRYRPAPASTHRWWNRMRAWLNRTATRSTSSGVTFWAFPSSAKRLRSGMRYDARGFQLSF